MKNMYGYCLTVVKSNKGKLDNGEISNETYTALCKDLKKKMTAFVGAKALTQEQFDELVGMM